MSWLGRNLFFIRGLFLRYGIEAGVLVGLLLTSLARFRLLFFLLIIVFVCTFAFACCSLTLPPPTLKWSETDGYHIEVDDKRDVINRIPSNTKKWIGRKMMGGVKLIGKGGTKLLEMAGEKKLPGMERALYGEVRNI